MLDTSETNHRGDDRLCELRNSPTRSVRALPGVRPRESSDARTRVRHVSGAAPWCMAEGLRPGQATCLELSLPEQQRLRGHSTFAL